MLKLQLDFTKVPGELRFAIAQEAKKVLAAVASYNLGFLEHKEKPYIILGYEDNCLNWNSRPHLPESFPVYDVLADWDKWTELVNPKWKTKTLAINADYKAEVHSDHIRVGCQKISFETFNKLAAIVKEAEAFKTP